MILYLPLWISQLCYYPNKGEGTSRSEHVCLNGSLAKRCRAILGLESRGEKRMTKIAVLNDYQNVSQSMADWGVLPKDCEVTVFTEALPPDLESRVTALQPFEVITCMRERTAFPRALLEKLPNLKLLVTTGMGNASF